MTEELRTYDDVPSTPFDGNVKTILVSHLADPTSPTVAELNAGLDISRYLPPGGLEDSVDQATISDQRETDIVDRQAPGRKTVSLSIRGIDNTNATNPDALNELAEALREGSRWFVVRRIGKNWQAPFTTEDKVRMIRFTTGSRTPGTPAANDPVTSTWATFADMLADNVRPSASIDHEPPVAAADFALVTADDTWPSDNSQDA